MSVQEATTSLKVVLTRASEKFNSGFEELTKRVNTKSTTCINKNVSKIIVYNERSASNSKHRLLVNKITSTSG